MREMEFVPDWYPRLRLRQRRIFLQAWMTIVVICGLGLWMFLASGNVRLEEQSLVGIRNELAKTASDLKKLDDLLDLQKQLRHKKEIIASLGLHVETTRLLDSLNTAMPAEMSLLDLSLEVEERIKPVSNLVKAAGQKKDDLIERRLKVKMLGVAPTDVDVADFLARLSNVPFFEQVTPTYARDRSESGHLMREFEVTFSVNLDTPPGT